MASIAGTIGNDTLAGTGEADVIDAGAGNDRVNGGLGNDTVIGGIGRDALYGDGGNDQLFGGADNDSLIGDAGDDEMHGEDGNDGAFGGGNNDRIFGGAGLDTLYGDGGNDLIDGGADDDRLYGGPGNDTIVGGTGNDLLDGGANDDVLVIGPGLGADTVAGGTGIDTIRLDISAADVTEALRADLAGFKSWMDAQLAAAGGSPAALGTAATGPTFTFASLGVTVSAIEALAITVDGAPVALDDLLNQAPVADAFAALATDEDTAVTGQVAATDADGDALTFAVASGPASGTLALDAATGAYSYTPDADYAGTDRFEIDVTDAAGATTRQLVEVAVAAVADAPVLDARDVMPAAPGPKPAVTTGSDTIHAGGGNDTISALGSDDLIYGDSVLVTTAALDIRAAATDTDGSESLEIVVSGLPAGAWLSAGTDNRDGSWTLAADDLRGLTVSSPDAGSFTLSVRAIVTEANGSSAETVRTLAVDLGTGNDYLTGGRGNDVIHAGFGDDLVKGDSGNDDLFGGSGKDTIDCGTGNDRISDGAGNDRVSGGSGNDMMLAGAGDDIYAGGSGFDTLDFSAASEALAVDMSRKTAAGFGADRFSSIEKVVGSAFADSFLGSKAADAIEAGAGADVIRGMGGADVLSGGDGDDTFVWLAKDVMSGKTHLGVDRIEDFAVGDRLDVSDITKGLKSGKLADWVRVDDGTAGSTLSVKMGGSFEKVAILEGVHGVTAGSLLADGLLIV